MLHLSPPTAEGNQPGHQGIKTAEAATALFVTVAAAAV